MVLVSKEKKCEKCDETVNTRKSKFCKKHGPNRYVDWSKITKKDLISRYKYQVHSRIRDLCRYRFKDILCNEKCFNCNYCKHLEVCHIFPINRFPDVATIDQINKIENLVLLCRNCHWEFDNNILILDEAKLKLYQYKLKAHLVGFEPTIQV